MEGEIKTVLNNILEFECYMYGVFKEQAQNPSIVTITMVAALKSEHNKLQHFLPHEGAFNS